jgi:uncharacterized membrane protein
MDTKTSRAPVQSRARQAPVAAQPRWAEWGALVAAAVGLAGSVYLTVEHYTSPAILACPEGRVIDCRTVTTSPQSVLFGVPVALLGAVFFVVMVALTLPVAWRSERPGIRLARCGLAVAGVAMMLYLLYAELFLIDAICLWCTLVHVAMLALAAGVAFGTADRLR